MKFFTIFILSALLFPFFTYAEWNHVIRIHNADEYPTGSNSYNWADLRFTDWEWLNLWMVIPETLRSWKDYFFIISERPVSNDICWNVYFLSSSYNLIKFWWNDSFDWRLISNSDFKTNKIFLTSVSFDSSDVWKDFRFTVLVTESWVLPKINWSTVNELRNLALNNVDQSQFVVSVREKADPAWGSEANTWNNSGGSNSNDSTNNDGNNNDGNNNNGNNNSAETTDEIIIYYPFDSKWKYKNLDNEDWLNLVWYDINVDSEFSTVAKCVYFLWYSAWAGYSMNIFSQIWSQVNTKWLILWTTHSMWYIMPQDYALWWWNPKVLYYLSWKKMSDEYPPEVLQSIPEWDRNKSEFEFFSWDLINFFWSSNLYQNKVFQYPAHQWPMKNADIKQFINSTCN